MDPFTGMSQDEMKKLDEVLQSEHAKALLEDPTGKLFATSKDVPLVTSEDGDVSVLMSTSIESLSGLSDLDNLESTISVPTDEDVANIACEIFHEDLDKPFEVDHVLLDHPYSLPASNANFEVKLDNTKQDLSVPGSKINQSQSAITVAPTRRSQRQLERAERVQTRKVASSKGQTPHKTELGKAKEIILAKIQATKDIHALEDPTDPFSAGSESEADVNTSDPSLSFIGEKTQVQSHLVCDISKTLKLLSPSDTRALRNVEISPVKPLSAMETIFADSPQQDTTDIPEELEESDSKFETLCIEDKPCINKRRASGEKASSPDKKPNKKEVSAIKSPRIKSLSFSEDNSESKSPISAKKRHLSVSDREASPVKVTPSRPKLKPKKKIIRSESLSADFLGPALFSTPDVMVKVKTGEDLTEKSNTKKLESSEISELDLLKAEIQLEHKSSEVDEAQLPKYLEENKGILKADIEESREILTTTNKMDSIQAKSKEPLAKTLHRLPGVRSQKCSPSNIKEFLMNKNREKPSVSVSETVQDIELAIKHSNQQEPPKPERKSQRTIQKKKMFDDDYSPERKIRKKKVAEAAQKEVVATTKREPRRKASKNIAALDRSESDDSEDSKSDPEATDDAEEDSDWDSEDDPEKVWCICRKPHNNKFMIQCDKCEDWFHGTCVSVTRQLGRQLEKEGKEWICPNCTKTILPAKVSSQAVVQSQSNQSKQAAKGQKNSLKKDLVKQAETPPKKLTKKPDSTKLSVANVNTNTKTNEVPHLNKPIKSPVKVLVKTDKPAVRNPIPKDFVLKSREPTVLPKSEVKTEKPVIKQEKTTTTTSVVKSVTKVDKSPKRVEVPKIERPVKIEKTKTVKPSVSQKVTPSKGNSESPQVSNSNEKKIVIREVTFLNNMVVKERKLLAVQKSTPFTKDSTIAKNANQSNVSPTKDMNHKPRNPKMNIWKEAKLKEAAKRSYVCISCEKPSPPGTIYCSALCLETYVNDSVTFIKNTLRPNEDLNAKKVDVLDRETGNLITGGNAPSVSELSSWLKRNPTFHVVRGIVHKNQQQQQQQQQKESKPQNYEKDDDDSTIEGVRLNVRKTLKNILLERCQNADDVKVTEEEVQKISLKIEEEMHSYFKDNSYKYRTKYRSLMFNIKDPRNQGLFRKILKGEIPPDQLVRMTTEELASVELTKWREKENQHSLDMIKRMQMEQSQVSAGLRKKTHKGEIEIEEEAIVGLDTEIDKEVPKTPPQPIEETIEVTPEKKEKIEEKDVPENDTTTMHRSHLFDLNCKICTGKMAPPPPDEPVPKKIRVAHSISVEQTSPKVSEADLKNPPSLVGDVSDDSVDLSSTTLSSPDVGSFRRKSKKSESSVWRGFIFMQDVAKFVSSAYKVSGPTDFLSKDIPDTLQVCGRINPQQVWDYLSKIKQSGNKELIVVCFRAANEEETATYNVFYNYLNSRKRCGVVNNSYSKMIKDFYILPLPSHKPVPTVLLPFDGPGLPSQRRHLLLGVLVRHRSKEKDSKATAPKPNNEKADETSYTPPLESNSYTPPLESRSYTPPLDNCTYTPPPDNVSYTPPLDDRSYTPPMDDEPSYTPPPIVDDEASGSVPIYNPTRSKSLGQESTSGSISRKETSVEYEEYEPSYTPPLEKMPKTSVPPSNSMNIISELMKKIAEKSMPSSPAPSASSDLEKQKQLLNELTRKVKETDLQVNQSLSDLKQLSVLPQDQVDIHKAHLSNSDVLSSGGMSSFLSMPTKNLQDILNSVKPKSQIESDIAENGKNDRPFQESLDPDMHNLFMGGKDTDSRTLPNYSPICANDMISPGQADVDERGSSLDRTPPPCEAMDEDGAEPRPSDPRIKLRTNFNSDSPKKSLSNMTSKELLERAQKELEAISPSSHYPVPNWDSSKEPPPPGIDPKDLDSFMDSSSQPASYVNQPLLSEGYVPSTPTTPSAFPIPPPGYPLHAPPPLPPAFMPPPNVPPPPLVRPLPPGSLDQRDDHYYPWPPDGPPPSDMDYRDRPPHWKHCPPYEEDHPDDWYYSRRGRSEDEPPWHDNDRYAGHGPRRWYPRRGRGNLREGNFRGRRNFVRRPQRE